MSPKNTAVPVVVNKFVTDTYIISLKFDFDPDLVSLVYKRTFASL